MVRQKDKSTEEKIKQAADKLFSEKGFSETKTRDIAKEAGINLALLNYYFRSKERLFELIMEEKFKAIVAHVLPIFNDTNTSLEEKINLISQHYISQLIEHPNLPLFVLGELKKHPDKFGNKLQIVTVLKESYFSKQLKEVNEKVQPENLIVSLLSLIVFPFVIRPALMTSIDSDKIDFDLMVRERQKLIPIWMQQIINVKLGENEG